jgi:signal transduction histidine kinase
VRGATALAGWLATGVLTAMWLLGRRALHARMEVVARACHELRGPLGAVRLGLDLGSRGGTLSARQLRAIDSELARAALALEDLADAREGHAAPRSLESLDLRELLADSVQAWRPSAHAVGAELRLRWTGPSTPVRGDRLRLAQAAGNLIANAIEHGGQVVEVRGCAHPGGPRIEVVDDGPGLPAPVAELAGRARHGHGRHGRGLAIAADIATAHGGRLAAAPAQRGARLVLDLPEQDARPMGRARQI